MVVQVNPTTTLVHTVDFFTPVVDDPYWYGRIAAANSLSDVYAMGGVPVTAMNIVCFPTRQLGGELLARILQGGLDTLREANVVLAGGHTVEDAEPKFGLAVTGLVQPERVTYKGGLFPGLELWLTKPIGSGIVTTAHKRDLASTEEVEKAIQWMAQLNDVPSRRMLELECPAATDITGYGLLGHAMEMARASEVRLEIRAGAVPWLPGVQRLRDAGAFPGGSAANRSWLEKSGQLEWDPTVPELTRDLLCDAQTSGGLLLGLPPGTDFGALLQADGRTAWRIGRAIPGMAGIHVVNSD